MKQPKMSANATKPTMERDQGGIRGSGVNKIAADMRPPEVPQVVMRNTYGKPTQTQKL